MDKKRIVEQEAICMCENWCNNGQPTPYPLTSADTPGCNEIEDYCMFCHFLKWKDIKVLNKIK